MASTSIKNIAFWLVILLSGALLWQVVKAGGSGSREREISFSKFLDDVDHGSVAEVVLAGADLHGKYKDASVFYTIVPANYPELIRILRDKDVTVTVKQNPANGWPTYLLNLSPLILFAALWFAMIRGMRRPGAPLPGRLWRPATEPPPLSAFDQGGNSLKQSSRLLLANSAGALALGYCRADHGQIIFYPESQIGAVVAWMLAPTPPQEVLGSRS